MAVYQCPANGNAYCGFWVYHSGINNLREYIGCKLIDSLVINTKYFITIKFNLSNSANCAINKIGILFTMNPYDTNYLSIINKAHLFSQNIINDTMNWIAISGSFISDSAYKYLAIGNFFNDSLTDTLHLQGNSCYSYYLVDDVCISLDSLTCVISNGYNVCDTGVNIIENNIKNETILIYPNPSSKKTTIKINGVTVNIKIFNSSGKLIKNFNHLSNEEISLNDFNAGIYFIQTVFLHKIVIEKLIIIN